MNRAFIKNIALVALFALALLPVGRAQSKIAGDWVGALHGDGAELRIALHITVAKDGALTATLDSLDQGALGIPVTAITLKDAKLNLNVNAIRGTYEGTVNNDTTEIDGTWTQGLPLALNSKRGVALPAAALKPAPPSDIDGTWSGTLQTGSGQLHLLFKIVNTQSGLTASLQSPDQSPAWIPATSVTRGDSSISIALKGIGAVFDGKIGSDLSSMDGTFTQMGSAMPLALKRAKK